MRACRGFGVVLCVLALAPAGLSEDPKPPRIGDRIDTPHFTDIRSLQRSLDEFGKKKAYVIAFVNTSCPLAGRYLPVLQELDREFGAQGVQFLALNADEGDSVRDVATQGVTHGISFPMGKDFDAACARALGVERTPEVAVLDGERRLRYRGRIDDKYRLGGERPSASRRDLHEALTAILAGRDPDPAVTLVDGCPIEVAVPQPPEAVTFAEHVAPILKKHCWDCHQPGGSAPFALTDGPTAARKARVIAEVVRDGRMPPWFASHDSGPFSNRRELSEREKTILRDWARSGTALGDLSRAPAPPGERPGRWQIGGEPDLILRSNVLSVPATGDVPYAYTILPHVFLEDTWVQAVQILPENQRIVHHCNMAFATLTSGFKAENFVTGYVPGGEAASLEDGHAFLFPRGSVLALQVHLVTTGKPETGRILVGLRFPRSPVQKRLRNMQLATTRFAIPPGDPAHRVAVSRKLPVDAEGVGLFSHMHLRGKDMTFTARYGDGKSETLLIIPNYNFNWQIPYRWKPGQKVFPRGTAIDCVAHFDNSSFNPYNPDPKATVRNGPQTHDEMMVGFFFYTDANEKLGLEIDPKTGHVVKEKGKEE